MPVPSPDTVAIEYTPPIATIPELESWEEVGEEYTTHNPVYETSEPITEEQFYSIYDSPRRTRSNNKKQKKTKSGRKTRKSKKTKKSKKRRYYK
jgi:hypothetical protein